MALRHIIAAVDASEAGLEAFRTALHLAERTSARVTALHVIAARSASCLVRVGGHSSYESDHDPAAERLPAWVDNPPDSTRVGLSIAHGVPAIEICRFAEQTGGDLIVLGRKIHASRTRLLLEDTADAVARRSRVPTLFVPPEGCRLQDMLVALDGCARGMRVLEGAIDFAQDVARDVRVVTVERPAGGGDPFLSGRYLPATRTARLQTAINEMLARKGRRKATLLVRWGCVVDEVLTAVTETGSGVLAIGYHRGGPAGIIDSGSTGQRLGHAAPCAVLTLPL